ncbi:D-galactonate dehydratase family protein [Microbacterium protaetiae]|uniref:D-galactonate dehydratase family protein n=1 Tax=Microbacterium protaetiae TaxID=2509458 RepID=A0A4P6EFM5_9MICO|nr:D-mannonate dehydratase ManD [Microbacterium protaetiae]QAY58917.1 D-galactonate dehydratase family protein [Microbacterium protaetiae]
MSTRIRSFEVLVSAPSRNFVTVRITTDDGVVGLGDATLNGRELAVVAYLREHVAALMIGRDALRIEDTWQFLYRSAYWRRGPVTMSAIAAVDMALWDITGRIAGMPVYQLLGGASRDGVLCYAHAAGNDLDALAEAVRQRQQEGFRAIRLQVAVPGMAAGYGVQKGARRGERYAYEPATRAGLSVEQGWDARAYLSYLPHVFEQMRGEFGAGPMFLHDAHHRLTPIQAARLGASLEPYDLFWLEDVTPVDNPEALRLVREHTTTPLAIGEVLNTVWDFRTLVQEQLIDYVRASVTHAGGITHLKRIFEFAAMYQVKSGSHGPTDISPVGMAAALHLDLAIHNFGMQEYMQHDPRVGEVFRTSYTFDDGMLHPGDAPGLGVDYDDEAAAGFPYAPAYLPAARLADGTAHEW